MKRLYNKTFNKMFRKNMQRLPIITVVILLASCEKFLEVDLPNSKISSELVFSDDITATSAVTGIYAGMLEHESFASGTNLSVSAIAGLSSDEFINNMRSDVLSVEVDQNSITSGNGHILNLWSSMYKSIYQANAVIEGLNHSEKVSDRVKNQLIGEARFVRALCHFYLVNLFGDVPFLTTTNYVENSRSSRVTANDVYEEIILDLKASQDLMGSEYVTSERVRPNQWAATALLARVYLYAGRFSDAETEASALIDNSSMYQLTNDVAAVFLKNSTEAIWQLRPLVTGNEGATNEAIYFGQYYQFLNVLNPAIVSDFESGDARLLSWVGSFDTGSGLIYYPTKYKQTSSFSPLTEYSMVLRLAEQYLIRAEARAKLGDISGAVADLDIIRKRAQIPLIQDTNPSINEAEVLLAVEHERFLELFTEWGHRWMDLRRTGRASAVLAPKKAGFSSTDELYPIPQSELDRNPRLGSQNPGY